MADKNIKKALTGLTLAGIIAGSTILSACVCPFGSNVKKDSCCCDHKENCEHVKQDKAKTSCSAGSCGAKMQDTKK